MLIELHQKNIKKHNSKYYGLLKIIFDSQKKEVFEKPDSETLKKRLKQIDTAVEDLPEGLTYATKKEKKEKSEQEKTAKPDKKMMLIDSDQVITVNLRLRDTYIFKTLYDLGVLETPKISKTKSVYVLESEDFALDFSSNPMTQQHSLNLWFMRGGRTLVKATYLTIGQAIALTSTTEYLKGLEKGVKKTARGSNNISLI